jgi:hypothetical protein
MKNNLLIALLVLCGASVASAQTVTCSISGLSSTQTAVLARMLVRVNAERAAMSPPQAAFSTVDAYCAFAAQAAIMETIAGQKGVDSSKVGAAAIAHGDETAITSQCTASGQAAGCSKSSVACFVLSGNITCS